MKGVVEYLLFACLAAVVNSQASEEQCAAQICCSKGNQDLSESCWSHCSSYQQQLANIGCHILPPTPTTSTTAPAAPTRTTSWGPGQFCQGYSPGGGDTCITIPAGCYIVPSGYNVEPQLFCTATATLSSSVVSSTASTVQITSSSAASSSRRPSSSLVLPSSTIGTPTSLSSSANPLISTPASSTPYFTSAPRATTSLVLSSSASTPPTITPPSSVTPVSSLASSSAVQSSALPGIVGGVVSSAATASSAAQAFSQNPTTDNENALKRAVSAAQDAATAAKALADTAAFTALSAELALVLSSFTEAAATLASAEALADIAAAVAPEIAAAAAAAASAKAIEDAGPRPSGQQPSANRPSVTQQSLSSAAASSITPSSASITSASSATTISSITASSVSTSGSLATTASSITGSSASITSGSLATTASFITSVSASSTATSSATVSASTCDACVACADSTIAAVPTPDPVDPFSEFAGSITDNSTAARSRKRFHAANFVEINARANSATRDVTICGKSFSAPSYNSYNGAGNGNSYSPYYSYSFQLPRCATYDWVLTQSPTAPPDSASYATEHIYELQLIGIFLRWLAANDANLLAYLAVNNRNICANFINGILFGQGAQWTTTPFGAGGNIRTAGSRPIDELLSQLSGGARSTELVYLNSHLNGLKALLFGARTPSSLSLAPAQLALVADSSALMLYLRDPHISAIFTAVSARLKNFYAKLDQACRSGGGSRRGPCAANVQWASAYQTWQAQYLARIEASWQGWKSAQVAAAVGQITPKARAGSATWTKLLEAVNGQLAGGGLLSPGRYGFAAGLTI